MRELGFDFEQLSGNDTGPVLKLRVGSVAVDLVDQSRLLANGVSSPDRNFAILQGSVEGYGVGWVGLVG